MARPLPPLTWFRAFEAASRHLNFTSAADEIGLTQSAVSQHVRSLETRLGVELFVRRPRGLALTDSGRGLQPQVGKALEMLGDATEGFDLGDQKDLLTIATSVSVAQWLLSPNLPEFMNKNSDLRIRILGTIWPDQFKASIADIEIRFGSHAQVGKDAHRLMPDCLIAVAAPDWTTPVQNSPLIETVGTSDGWRQWFEATGLSPGSSPAIAVDAYGMALEIASKGNGIALASSLLATKAIAAGTLRQVHPTSIPCHEGYFLAVNSGRPAAKSFEEWVLDLVDNGA